MTLDELYTKILMDLYAVGEKRSPRGEETKELRPYFFILRDITDNIVKVPGFETNINYAKTEFEWYLTGNGNLNEAPELIKKTWARYSDDGETVNSNYGERIFGKHAILNINQWDYAKELLTKDPHTRRATININSYFDKLNRDTKDYPCTQYLQFFITNDNKLEMGVHMGSNDVYKGLRNDIYCFTQFQKKMADELNLGYGIYKHYAGSMHLYAEQFSKVKAMIENRSKE
ncbi:MAG TPA: thymidylate synthase [Alphaproteobacteria bacterium]|nr:thymidylate synthase [Alphaproteobacteria bacterium]